MGRSQRPWIVPLLCYLLAASALWHPIAWQPNMPQKSLASFYIVYLVVAISLPLTYFETSRRETGFLVLILNAFSYTQCGFASNILCTCYKPRTSVGALKCTITKPYLDLWLRLWGRICFQALVGEWCLHYPAEVKASILQVNNLEWEKCN